MQAEAGNDGWVILGHLLHQVPVLLRGAVDREVGDAGSGGGAYEGGRDGHDAGVLEVAVRVEEPHSGGGARRSLGHDRRLDAVDGAGDLVGLFC